MKAHADRREQMLALVREWRQSGVTGREFAASHGVSYWTLQYWRGQLQQPDRAPTRSARRPRRRVALAPVHVLHAADAGGSDVEIVLVGGDRIRLAASVSPDRLRRLVELLRA